MAFFFFQIGIIFLTTLNGRTQTRPTTGRGGTWAQLAVEYPWGQKSTFIWFWSIAVLLPELQNVRGGARHVGIYAKSLSVFGIPRLASSDLPREISPQSLSSHDVLYFSCLCYNATQLYASHALGSFPRTPSGAVHFSATNIYWAPTVYKDWARSKKTELRNFENETVKVERKVRSVEDTARCFPHPPEHVFRKRTECINGIKYFKRRRKMSRVNETHESSEQQCPKDQNRRKMPRA